MEQNNEIVEETVTTQETKKIDNEKGYSIMYNLTLVSAVATVAMFVVGTALYLTVMS